MAKVNRQVYFQIRHFDTGIKYKGKIMTMVNKQKLMEFFDQFDESEGQLIENNIAKYLDDEAIEMFVDHLEDFYGIEDEEELGYLAQVMISGYIAAKLTSTENQ